MWLSSLLRIAAGIQQKTSSQIFFLFFPEHQSPRHRFDNIHTFPLDCIIVRIGGGEAGISALREAKKKGMSVSVYDRSTASQKRVEAAGGYFLRCVSKTDKSLEEEEEEEVSSCDIVFTVTQLYFTLPLFI